jgi:hypothetical protein
MTKSELRIRLLLETLAYTQEGNYIQHIEPENNKKPKLYCPNKGKKFKSSFEPSIRPCVMWDSIPKLNK